MAQHHPELARINAQAIGTPDELFHYLNHLSAVDSGPMGSMLAAQVEALRFVQSPRVVASAITRTLDNIVWAMDSAASGRERQQIKRLGLDMVNNFVMYIEAKYQADIAGDRAQAQRVLHTLAHTVLAGVTEAAGAVAGGAGLQVATFTGNSGLLSGLIDLGFQFFSNHRSRADREAEFIKTVEGVINTLDLYSDQLGMSNVVASLVRTYTNPIVEYDMSLDDAEIARDRFKGGAYRYAFMISAIITAVMALLGKVVIWVLTLVLNIIFFIPKLLKIAGPDLVMNIVGFLQNWFWYVAIFINGYLLLRWIIVSVSWRSLHSERRARGSRLRSRFSEIADRFREGRD